MPPWLGVDGVVHAAVHTSAFLDTSRYRRGVAFCLDGAERLREQQR